MGGVEKLSRIEQEAVSIVLGGGKAYLDEMREHRSTEVVQTAAALLRWLEANKKSLMTYVQAARNSGIISEEI